MDYSKAFRIVRAAFGLSQADFARLINVSPSQMSLIESGKRQPSHKVIKQLAAALQLPVHMITLLAADSKDLERQGSISLEPLAMALLRLLVSASGEQAQPPLPFTSDERYEE
jgi:transcriptional regulator with XRE-family HTH domain